MLNEIYKRQSIRKYLNKEVEKEKIEELLRAAMNAPTARNRQSWRFRVIRNRKTLADMATLSPYMGMMKDAPCAILVMGDQSASNELGFLYLDAGAAIENMLIEVVHQGLAACWCGIAPIEERMNSFHTYFKLEEHIIPIALVAIGYGDEVKEIEDRFDPQKISYDE